jgi:hypothetical protein
MRRRAMALVAVFQGTREQYEQVISSFTGGKTRPDSPNDWPVEGLLAHVAGEAQSGFRVVDVWDSEESFKQFGEILGPIFEKFGIVDVPEVYPAYAFVTA